MHFKKGYILDIKTYSKNDGYFTVYMYASSKLEAKAITLLLLNSKLEKYLIKEILEENNLLEPLLEDIEWNTHEEIYNLFDELISEANGYSDSYRYIESIDIYHNPSEIKLSRLDF